MKIRRNMKCTLQLTKLISLHPSYMQQREIEKKQYFMKLMKTHYVIETRP